MDSERVLREARGRRAAAARVNDGSFPSVKRERREPTPAEIEEVYALLKARQFWIDTGGGKGWVSFPARETARLLATRMWNPRFGAQLLLQGGVFKPTPRVSIRTAVQIQITRIDRRE